ncbi:LPXTG cell wall anchor domain-containing protein [Staphylococcus sp. NRL 21/187]|nr:MULTISPECIES: LPXTG cell wall anchor domain-containing protein [unclassified Staphylococcus]MCJ1657087.1 LPXTG cell wall anchor domain-containing protein [Staphylococcus sp. NRL 21/187]MCJ1668947.1 LPXTG cell wall anchor domain-containing protein [Staphylococcus sp. NRL 19/737]
MNKPSYGTIHQVVTDHHTNTTHIHNVKHHSNVEKVANTHKTVDQSQTPITQLPNTGKNGDIVEHGIAIILVTTGAGLVYLRNRKKSA